jgi:hypothetical protein
LHHSSPQNRLQCGPFEDGNLHGDAIVYAWVEDDPKVSAPKHDGFRPGIVLRNDLTCSSEHAMGQSTRRSRKGCDYRNLAVIGLRLPYYLKSRSPTREHREVVRRTRST